MPVSFRDLLDAAWPKVEQAIAPRLDWIVGLWCLGVCLFALRPAIGIREIRRLRRVGVSPVADNIAALLGDLARRMGLARPVAILQSACAPVPVVVGHLRPLILLPVSLVSQMPIVQLEAILPLRRIEIDCVFKRQVEPMTRAAKNLLVIGALVFVPEEKRLNAGTCAA